MKQLSAKRRRVCCESAGCARIRRWPDGREHGIERAGHGREVERLDQQTRVAELAAGSGADEAVQLALDGLPPVGRLALQRPERVEFPLAVDDRNHAVGADRPD